MRVLTIIHQDDAGPGVFAEVAAREGVELVPWLADRDPAPALERLDAALVLGAAVNMHQISEHPWLHEDVRVVAELIERRIPTLGVCLGAQLLADAGGGSVRRAAHPEIGWQPLEMQPSAADDPVLGELPAQFTSFQWHSYEAVPPEGAIELARSAHALQAYRLADAPAWAIQFHAEVSSAAAAQWIADYEADPDAIALSIDPVALQVETDRHIEDWNELGRSLFGRFLRAARSYSAVT